MVSGLVALGAFLVTSPYVVLDFGTFVSHLSGESTHMSVGHFGQTGTPSALFYASALAHPVLGWPLTVLALIGVAIAIMRRTNETTVLLAFTFPYLLTISLWTMHAERYLLPVIPCLLVFAGVAVGWVGARLPSRQGASTRALMLIALALVVVVPSVSAHATRVNALRHDPRTVARDWIESNVERGSLIVSEPLGPELFPASTFLRTPPQARKSLLDALGDRPVYAIQLLQMFQSRPQLSAPFYDVRLYEDADYIITTSAVSSRYQREPDRFAPQLAFYNRLDRDFTLVKTFTGQSGGSGVTVYRNPAHSAAFARRQDVAPVPDLAPGLLTGMEAPFYLNAGLNFEIYSHLSQAADSYQKALSYAIRANTRFELVMRATTCYMRLNQFDDALRFVDAAIQQTTDNETRARFRQYRDRIQSAMQQR